MTQINTPVIPIIPAVLMRKTSHLWDIDLFQRIFPTHSCVCSFAGYGNMPPRLRVKHAFDVRRVRSRSLCVGTRGLCSGAMALPSTDRLMPSPAAATIDGVASWLLLSADIRRPDGWLTMHYGERAKKKRFIHSVPVTFFAVLSRTPSLSNGPDDGDCEDDADDDDGCRCEYC